MKAFIGRRMWLAHRRWLDVERRDLLTWTTSSSSPGVVDGQPVGSVADQRSSAALTATHVQLTVELLAGWTWCVTNVWNSSAPSTGDNVIGIEPGCIPTGLWNGTSDDVTAADVPRCVLAATIKHDQHQPLVNTTSSPHSPLCVISRPQSVSWLNSEPLIEPDKQQNEPEYYARKTNSVS